MTTRPDDRRGAWRRFVVTRPAEAGASWLGRLVTSGRRAISVPVTRFAALPLADLSPVPPGIDWVLFTSPQGVRAFHDRFGAPAAAVACLGHGTRSVAEGLGVADALGIDAPDGVAFAAAFAAQVSPPARLLMPGAERRMRAPLTRLGDAGFEVVELPLYRTGATPPDALPPWDFDDDIVLFASPSAVRAWMAGYRMLPERSVAIGETTAGALCERGGAPAVAARPDLDAMVAAADARWRDDDEPG